MITQKGTYIRNCSVMTIILTLLIKYTPALPDENET